MKTSRRDFIRLTAAAGAGLVIAGAAGCSHPDGELRVIAPIDGDMLTENDGIITSKGLKTKVRIAGPKGARIRVNGVAADKNGEEYQAEVLLKRYRNDIEFRETKSGKRQTITV